MMTLQAETAIALQDASQVRPAPGCVCSSIKQPLHVVKFTGLYIQQLLEFSTRVFKHMSLCWPLIACYLQLQHAFSQRGSSSSGSDGSLTWEVPPVLERTFGPTAEAVADDLVAVAAPAAGSDGTPASTEGEAANTSNSSSGRPLSPSSQPLSSSSGLHPVVLLNRQELARAADEHLQQLLWQLLQAEDVQQPDLWLPIVLRLVCEASKALLPAAAAAFGEQDPRFYVKVSASRCCNGLRKFARGLAVLEASIAVQPVQEA
jgi:hypothetical protein